MSATMDMRKYLKLAEENRRVRDALVQVRGFAAVMAENNWRDCKTYIDRQCDAIDPKFINSTDDSDAKP